MLIQNIVKMLLYYVMLLLCYEFFERLLLCNLLYSLWTQ